MRKKYFLIIPAILLTLFNTIASSVSENDGSAFITKAEFDSLKNSFQSQIDSYNTGIDNKIDAAIASYLAGISIKSKVTQGSYLNTINPQFQKGKSFLNTNLGKYAKIYCSVAYACAASSGRQWTTAEGGDGNYYADLLYIFEGSCDSWYTCKELEVEKTNPDIFYNISTTKIDGVEYYKINYLQQSKYAVLLAGGAGGRRGWNMPKLTSYWNFDSVIVDRGTRTTFGARIIDLAISAVEDATGSTTETAYVSWSFTDNKDTTVKDIDYLSGEKLNVGTSDKVYCMLDTEMNEIDTTAYYEFGTEPAKAKNMGSARHWYLSNHYVNKKHTDGSGQKIHINLYRHKYKTLKQTDFINNKISNTIGEATHYYEGCPMFKASSNGTATVKLKFSNDSSKNTTFAISNAAFANATITGGATGIEKCDNTDWVAGPNETVTLSFKAVANETYWIKALPVSGVTTITSESIEIESEK